MAKKIRMFTKVTWFGACFTSLWVFLEWHQPLAYSRETCSPTVEEMNLLAATGSEVPDCLKKSPTFSSPGTSYPWNYTGTTKAAQHHWCRVLHYFWLPCTDLSITHKLSFEPLPPKKTAVHTA